MYINYTCIYPQSSVVLCKENLFKLVASFEADEDVLNSNDRYLNGEIYVMFSELNV